MICEYVLSPLCIDEISEQIVSLLKGNNIDSKDILSVRLSSEELLMKYLNMFDESVPVFLKCEKHFSEIRIIISIQCSSYNPFIEENDDFELMNKLLRKITIAPVWNYRRNCNNIIFSIAKKKKIPDFMYYIFAAIAGIICGFFGKRASSDFYRIFSDEFLTPVSDVIMGLLNQLSVIMVFTSVISGICGMGNVQTFKKIGIRMITRFMVILLGCISFVTAVSLLFISFGSKASATVNVSSLWQLIINIVPTNIFSAFYNGNVLQIIFIAVLCGVVILITMPKTNLMSEWMDNANQIIQKMLEIAVKPMPIVVFISIFKMILFENILDYSGIFKYMFIMIICCAAMTLFSILRVCIINKMSLVLLIKKLFPTYLIALSTASSAAAYTTNVETCKKSLGIDQSIFRIGIPFGQIIFKPCTIFQCVCGCLCFAEIYGINISSPQLFMLLFTVFILSVAEPPVPGVLICCFTLLFSQIGVPVEALSIILALECILDRLGTSTNLLSLQAELIRLADSMCLLDENKLKKE